MSMSLTERANLEDRVPVAGGALGAEFAFDQIACQLRAADPRRVNDIEVVPLATDNLRPLDRGLKRVYVLRPRCRFQKHDEQMAWVVYRLSWERVPGNERFPLRRAAEEVVGGHSQALHS